METDRTRETDEDGAGAAAEEEECSGLLGTAGGRASVSSARSEQSLEVRGNIICHARKKYVGKTQSCMV